jgi:Holliday junction resolvase RusA-like endonuclease
MSMPQYPIVIHWEGPFTVVAVAAKTGEDNCGLYQIYSNHFVHGQNTLLYIGKAQDQSFAERIGQHQYWLNEESGVEVYLGRLDPSCYRDEPPDWTDWRLAVSQAEALTIYWHSPPYNSHYIRGYSPGPISIRNDGSLNKLKPEYPHGRALVGPNAGNRLVVTFTVEGSLRGGGESEEGWKKRCRCLARAALDAGQVPLPVSSPVKIIARFFVSEAARAHDLDNMLKLLIDAIGASGFFSPSKTGGIASEWNTDDGLVYALDAAKSVVKDGARTEVELWWEDRGPVA